MWIWLDMWIGWSPYSSRCKSICWNWHFPIPDGITRFSSLVTPNCSLSCPTLWKPSGNYGYEFLWWLFTWTRVCLDYRKCFFTYYVNTYLFMCRSKRKRLVISSSYHTCISFILNPVFYSITYPSWFATSYNCPSFMLLMWSYHLQFKYPFALVPSWEWTYNSPQYTSGYYCNYYFGEWKHMFKNRSATFSFVTPKKEWISLSLEMTSKPWWTSSLLTWLAHIWCNEHQRQQHM